MIRVLIVSKQCDGNKASDEMLFCKSKCAFQFRLEFIYGCRPNITRSWSKASFYAWPSKLQRQPSWAQKEHTIKCSCFRRITLRGNALILRMEYSHGWRGTSDKLVEIALIIKKIYWLASRCITYKKRDKIFSYMEDSTKYDKLLRCSPYRNILLLDSS